MTLFFGNPKFDYGELETLLDLAPQAALLVDTRSRKILAGNGEASRLSGHSSPYLAGKNLDEVFCNLDLALDQRGEGLAEIVSAAGEKLLVHANLAPLHGSSQKALVQIQPFAPAKNGESSIDFQPATAAVGKPDVWGSLLALIRSISLPEDDQQININLGAALQAAIQVIASLLEGAPGTALYLVRPEAPGLERVAATGCGTGLPETLAAPELGYLLKTQIWLPDQRSLAALHRSARMRHFTYLATAPISYTPLTESESAQAVTGLVVIGNTGEPATASLLANLLASLPQISALMGSLLTWEAFLKSVEQALEEQRYQQALGNVLDRSQEEGILGLSRDFRLQHMNSAAETLLGYAFEEVKGLPVEQFLIGTSSLTSMFEEAEKGRTIYSPKGLRIYRRNGDDFPALLRMLPIRHQHSLLGILLMLKDRSEHEQAREHTEQLEQRAILGEVTAIFAHEVRNPINNISTGLQLMVMDLPEENPNHAVAERLLADCDRLEELMKSVLAFAKPTDYSMEPVDLGVLLERTLERLRSRMLRVDVKPHFQVEEDLPKVMANSRALEQVFYNLMNNATQAMSEKGGHLAVKARVVPRDPSNPSTRGLQPGVAYVEVSIADTGPGIPKENLERIFQPFFTTKRDGTGLGLAISKRIITAHRGGLRVESFAGGTVFLIHLPFS